MRKVLFCLCLILTMFSVTLLIFQNDIEDALANRAAAAENEDHQPTTLEKPQEAEREPGTGQQESTLEPELDSDDSRWCDLPHTKDGIGGAGGFIIDDPNCLELLARAIYAEAGGDECSDETRIMVGNVILNRMKDPRYPDTMEAVLTQPRQYNIFDKTGVVWKDRASDPDEQDAVERAYRCAERVLLGEKLLPDDVVFQSENIQGTEIVAYQDGIYFCR